MNESAKAKNILFLSFSIFSNSDIALSLNSSSVYQIKHSAVIKAYLIQVLVICPARVKMCSWHTFPIFQSFARG